MVQKLKAKDIKISETSDRRNLKILFGENAIVDMFQFVEKTEVGKRPEAENNKVNSWNMKRLDWKEEGAAENGV